MNKVEHFKYKLMVGGMISSFIMYITFSIYLFGLVLSSCISEIIFLNKTISQLFYEPRFFLYLLSIIFLLFVFYRITSAIIFFFFSIIQTRLFIGKLNKDDHGRFIVFNSEYNYAFTAGFLKPEVFISKGLVHSLTQGELDKIIKHEESHKRSYDPLKKLIVKTFIKSIIPLPRLNTLYTNFIGYKESVANIDFELINKITSVNKFSVINYSEVNELKKQSVYPIVLLLVFSITISLGLQTLQASNKNELSLCEDKTSCLKFESNANISSLPGQCKTILYSPVENFSSVDIK